MQNVCAHPCWLFLQALTKPTLQHQAASVESIFWCAVYVYVSYRLFLLTNTLKSAVIPAKVGPLLWRNFAIFGLASAFLYITALLMVHIVPFTPLMSPILAPRTV